MTPSVQQLLQIVDSKTDASKARQSPATEVSVDPHSAPRTRLAERHPPRADPLRRRHASSSSCDAFAPKLRGAHSRRWPSSSSSPPAGRERLRDRRQRSSAARTRSAPSRIIFDFTFLLAAMLATLFARDYLDARAHRGRRVLRAADVGHRRHDDDGQGARPPHHRPRPGDALDLHLRPRSATTAASPSRTKRASSTS